MLVNKHVVDIVYIETITRDIQQKNINEDINENKIENKLHC